MNDKVNKSNKKPKEQSIFTKTYLLVYNFGQVLGWSYMLYQLVNYYSSDLRKTTLLWDYIGTTVVIFQNAAVLEVNLFIYNYKI